MVREGEELLFSTQYPGSVMVADSSQHLENGKIRGDVRGNTA
jgi:hypothetical protein